MARYVNAEDVMYRILENLNDLSELINTAKGADREKLVFKEFGLVDAMDHLRETPTADVREVVHGTWIKHDDGYVEYYECSHCLKMSPRDNEFDFCPWCGADMREGGE